ncbi:MAG: enoyl-CoA hydratase-related protein [Actinomycetota bacterium]|nr:enoyl-CoA hydratase-related protein [Actinomycetota bacterium]
MSDHETITYEAGDGIATITLARPDKRNAMNSAMFLELGEATEEAARDPAVRVVLVRGDGPSFCAGIDVSSFAELAGAGTSAIPAFVRLAQRPFRNLATMAKPTVAAVRGNALGAGFQLALACDLRVVADDARMGMLEIRFGLVPDLGGNRPLAALAGPDRAKELIWTGRIVEAEEADRLGLCTRLVPADGLDENTRALAEELAAAPPIPVSLVKSLVVRAPETTLEAMFEREGQGQLLCLSSEDHREAVAAFFEKRPGRFEGR